MTPVAELKRVHRATWAAGDYAAVAELIDETPPRDLLAREEATARRRAEQQGVAVDWVEGDAEAAC